MFHFVIYDDAAFGLRMPIKSLPVIPKNRGSNPDSKSFSFNIEPIFIPTYIDSMLKK